MKMGCVFWLVLFWVYLLCMPGTFYFEDSPELAACSLSLGNAHPPGYPLLILLGRLAHILPVGGPCFRFNLLVAASGAGAAVLLGLLVFRLATDLWPEARRGSLAAGVLAAGSWAFSDAFWWEATIGDKYSPYYLAFMAVALLGADLLGRNCKDAGRRSIFMGLATGTCYALHYYAVFVLPLAVLAFIRAAFCERRRGKRNWPRVLWLAILLGILPISTRLLYPPIRSAAGTELNWGRPDSAFRLKEYLGGSLYKEAFAASSISEGLGGAADRFLHSLRLLNEEFPIVLMVGIPAGLLAVFRLRAWLAAGLVASALCNWIYALNFTEKVVRWYEPAYGIMLAFSAIGVLYVLRRPKGKGAALLAVLAVLSCGWQLQRGHNRCNLSAFYAAHDFARNLLASLPPGAIYLGAGDFDLFPLWAVRHCEGFRRDVEGVGLASFLDSRLAGAGNQVELMSRLDLPAEPRAALVRLLAMRNGIPVMVAPAGYDMQIYERIPEVAIQQTRGLAGRFQRHWDAAGSFEWSRRIHRAYTYRCLNYARAGALTDMGRPRDEVARGAMLQYPLCFSVLARQGFRFRMDSEGEWAIEIARRQVEALVGDLERNTRELAPGAARARADKFIVAEGFQRLADLFEERGVPGLAAQYRECARGIAE